jgi:hypothetical protein
MSVKQVFNTSAELDYPTVLPTLDLDFANSKTLDPRITFTRASGGSYVGADGLIKYAGVNEARFDHDPYTGESLGLLVEESRTNSVLYSQSFIDRWDASFTSGTLDLIDIVGTDNTTTSPDGTTNAATLTNSLSGARAGSIFTATIGTTKNSALTFSCFLKANTTSTVNLELVCNTNVSSFVYRSYATFTLTGSGSVSSVTNVAIDSSTPSGTASIQQYSNDWYKCIISFATYNGVNSLNATLAEIRPNSGSASGSIYAWGRQLEAGAFPTSYIPTVASTRTRSADNASITGKNFSSFYNPSEGTLFAQFKTELNIRNDIWSINNYPATTFGTINNYFRLLTLSNIIHTQYNVGGTNLYPQFSLTNNNFQKVIQSYNINSSPIISALNGTIGTGSGNIYATSPGFNQLEFGKNTDQRTTIGQYTISRLSYYPKRLPNQQLQALTR